MNISTNFTVLDQDQTMNIEGGFVLLGPYILVGAIFALGYYNGFNSTR